MKCLWYRRNKNLQDVLQGDNSKCAHLKLYNITLIFQSMTWPWTWTLIIFLSQQAMSCLIP